MQWQKVTVPMGKGLDEASDERVRPMDVPSVLVNARFDKAGRIATRRGFKVVPMLRRATGTLWGDGSVRGLFSTGRELVMAGDRYLWAADLVNERWHERGRVTAVGHVKERGIFHDSHSYRCADLAVAGLTTGHAFGLVGLRTSQVSYDELTHAHNEYALEVYAALPHGTQGSSSSDDDRRVLLGVRETLDEATVTSSKPHGPRAAFAGETNLLAFWMGSVPSAANPTTLEWARLDFTSLTAEPSWSVGSAVTSDLFYNGDNVRTFDVIGLREASYLANRDYVVAFIDNTSGNVNVERYSNFSGTPAATAFLTTDAPYVRVAIAETESTSHIYVAGVSEAAGPSRTVYLWKLSKSTLTTTWGPVVVLAVSGDDVEGLGVVEVGNNVAVTFSRKNASTDKCDFYTQVKTTSGGGGSGPDQLPHCNARSRPFVHNSRAYCWVDSALAESEMTEGYQATELFEYTMLVDLRVGESLTPLPMPESVRAVGTGVPHFTGSGVGNGDSPSINWGNGNNVVEYPAASGNFFTAATSVALPGGEENAWRRYRAHEVMASFADPIGACSPFEGALMFGGGMPCWYDGQQTMEVGFFTAPIIIDFGSTPAEVTISGPSTLPVGTYTYGATYEYSDALGVLHRSLPAPPVKWETTSPGTEDALEIKLKNAPGSWRDDDERAATHVVYRAASDGVFRRISQPTAVIERAAVATTRAFNDYGQYLDSAGIGTGTPLYTEGGAIEAVFPSGCRIVAKIRDRVWIADGARQDFVQYSKPIAPGTAAETRVAPEFNEGFGLFIPSGARCTGLAELDDKVIIFTAREIYMVAGQGPADDGSANDFSGMSRISSDTGCLDFRSVASTPRGVLFRGDAGIYLLNRGLAVEFIGSPVEDTTTAYPVVTSAVLVARDSEVRFTCQQSPDTGTDAVTVVFNYESQQWSLWELRTAAGELRPFVAATMHNGVYYAVTSDGQLWAETGTGHAYDSTPVYAASSYDVVGAANIFVPLAVETGWIAPAQPQGWARIRYVMPLLEMLDPCDVKLSVFHDYNDTASHSYQWESASLSALPEYPRAQPKFHVVRQKCQAIKVRVEGVEDGTNTTTGAGFTLAGITLEVGVKRKTYNAAATQRS